MKKNKCILCITMLSFIFLFSLVSNVSAFSIEENQVTFTTNISMAGICSDGNPDSYVYTNTFSLPLSFLNLTDEAYFNVTSVKIQNRYMLGSYDNFYYYSNLLINNTNVCALNSTRAEFVSNNYIIDYTNSTSNLIEIFEYSVSYTLNIVANYSTTSFYTRYDIFETKVIITYNKIIFDITITNFVTNIINFIIFAIIIFIIPYALFKAFGKFGLIFGMILSIVVNLIGGIIDWEMGVYLMIVTTLIIIIIIKKIKGEEK